MDLRPWQFQAIALPPRHTIDDHGDELAMETAPALRRDFQSDASGGVLLAIHYDTVFGVTDPFQTCELITNDCLQGPALLMPGRDHGHPCRLTLNRFELSAGIGWTVLLTPDEEVGSLVFKSLFERIAPDFDFALLFEPALPGGELVSHRKARETIPSLFMAAWCMPETVRKRGETWWLSCVDCYTARSYKWSATQFNRKRWTSAGWHSGEALSQIWLLGG